MPTFVYVHGLGDDDTVWEPLRREPALDGFNHRPYCTPGFEDRPWNGERVEDLVLDVGEFVAEMSEPVVLVGHSLGGVIGTLLAEAPPDNLQGFVSIEGNLTPADCGISAAAAQATDFDRWFDLFVGRMPTRYALALRRSDPRAFRALAEDLVRLSDGMGERYVAIDVPKLLIYGTNGYESSTQAWVRSAGVEAVCVEGAGHWVHEDAPRETAVAIRTFLDA